MHQPGHQPHIDLANYQNAWFSRGRSKAVEAAWLLVQALFVSSWLPGAAHRAALLRFFGAKVGKGVDMKPGLKVKFPWRLEIGNNSWIGEDVWIDNLAPVKIGSNCCVSQGAYLCTGSHDWTQSTFNLVVKPIELKNGAWVAARATVAPGVVVGEGAVLLLGAVAAHNLEPWAIYSGVPAVKVRKRSICLPSKRS